MGPYDYDAINELSASVGLIVVCRHLCRDYDGAALLDRIKKRLMMQLPEVGPQ